MSASERARHYNPPLQDQYSKTGDEAEEQAGHAAMEQFVTDPDGAIYAVKPIVPELFSALLKARYSRTELSAKQLLWREFVSQKEDIPWQTIEAGLSALNHVFNFEKAQGMADRILLQYGDDSVFELGGAHLFLDRVSMVASKVIEDARIGISPLEKSTRYVVFDQKDGNGDYSFFKDPAIMDSKHKELYLSTTRACFAVYADAIPKLMEHFTTLMPIESQQFPDMTESNALRSYADITDEKSLKAASVAYKFSVRSKACDVARVLLPASTLTNIGEFGNARAYGYLFTKMQASDLAEMQMIGHESVRELKKVLPKFFDVVDNQHGQEFQAYMRKTEHALAERASQVLGGVKPHPSERVKLVALDENPEVSIAAALLYPYSELPLQQVLAIVKQGGERLQGDILHDALKFRTNRRHKPPRGFEIAGYELVFDILGNFGIFRDLHRQRMLTQQHQSYTVRYGHDLPTEFGEIGVADEAEALMSKVAQAYETVRPDFPLESQYLTTMAHYTRWYVGLNLREAFWYTELRSVPQGHFSYRTIAQDMFLQAQARYPFLKDLTSMGEHYVDMTDRSQNLERMEAQQKIQVRLAQIEDKYGKA